ncbi:MAG: EamA family transporter [Pseudomonadota bacterium]
MTPLIIALALSAAVLHASWNALAKTGSNPVFNIAAYQLVSTGLCIGFLPFVPLPHPESWPLLIASVIIHTFYYFSLARAYQSGDLSSVYPLLRGMAPILVAVGGMVFASEFLSTGGIVGVLVISVGIMSLTFSGARQSRMSSVALVWGSTTAVLIASYTLVDGLGVRAAGNPLSYILWLFALESIPVVTILLLTQRAQWFDYLGKHRLQALYGGAASTLAYGLVIYAMSLGAMAVVSSLRETSVIFATLIGSLILKEPFGAHRLRAALIVACGIVIMRLW